MVVACKKRESSRVFKEWLTVDLCPLPPSSDLQTTPTPWKRVPSARWRLAPAFSCFKSCPAVAGACQWSRWSLVSLSPPSLPWLLEPSIMSDKRVSRWYFGGLASCGAACCTHPLDLLKVSLPAAGPCAARRRVCAAAAGRVKSHGAVRVLVPFMSGFSHVSSFTAVKWAAVFCTNYPLLRLN